MTGRGSQRIWGEIILAALVTGSLLAFVALGRLWPDWRLISPSLHATVEALGGLIAIVTATLLLQRRREAYGGRFFLLALAFIGMGILDVFHGAAAPGKGIVFLQSVTSLAGSLWFALVWFPSLTTGGERHWERWAPWVVATCALGFGSWTLASRETLPVLVVQGSFTLPAVAMNAVAGTFFMLGAARLLLDCRKRDEAEIYLLACMAALFGLSSFTFRYSARWDSTWWLWHLLRAGAWATALGFALRQQQRTVTGLMHMGEALERQLVEHTRAEEKYRTILQTTLDGFWVADDRGRLLEVNDAFCRLTGYTRDELLTMFIADIEAEECPGAVANHIERIKANGGDRFETRHRCKNGGLVDLEVSVMPIGSGGTHLVAFLRDITDRKRAEDALRTSETRLRLFRTLIDHSSDAIEVIDPDTFRILDVNERGCLDLGYSREELLSLTALDVDPTANEAAMAPALEELRKSGAITWEGVHRRKDGTTFPVEVKIRRVWLDREYFVTAVRDITNRRLVEAERARYAQAQRIESVGRLAGGIAHDFNNLLTVITGSAHFLLDALAPGDARRLEAEQILKAGERAAGLTKQLLAFSRKQVLEPRRLDVNTTVTNLSGLLRRLVGEDIDLLIVLGQNVGTVFADHAQLEQVIMNLAINARDAMPRGGKLTIATTHEELDQTAFDHPAVEPGSYVRLVVADTGTGISADAKSHLFEPFFTTKERGKGTGLGLASVYGVVKQSGGYIFVDSELGRGSTFTIYLPRLAGAVQHEAGTTVHVAGRPSGTETVLVAEDEEEVGNFIHRTLRTLGYHVLLAREGNDALRLAHDHNGPIDLLVTDVVMPEMGGRALADHLKTARPEIRVLFISGYAGDAIVHEGRLDAGVELLQKPFTPGALARKIRGVLDAAPPGGTSVTDS